MTPLKLEFFQASEFPSYYKTLCTFTCPRCGGLITWGAFECFGFCDSCIDEFNDFVQVVVMGRPKLAYVAVNGLDARGTEKFECGCLRVWTPYSDILTYTLCKKHKKDSVVLDLFEVSSSHRLNIGQLDFVRL